MQFNTVTYRTERLGVEEGGAVDGRLVALEKQLRLLVDLPQAQRAVDAGGQHLMLHERVERRDPCEEERRGGM